MKKIIIFGNSGAGKSTLAKQLRQKFNLKHLDLDTLAWSDAEIPTRKPLIQSTEEIDVFLSHSSGWVVEGGYTDLLDHVVEQVNEMIFINQGVDVCVEHCQQRPWEPHKYASKEEQDKNLAMLITWVKEYYIRDDAFSLKAHKEIFSRFSGNKSEINEGEIYSF